jgi:rhodanese-related sulfurtransferase
MAVQTITPEAAQRLLDEGAVLVDIRSAGEYARERIEQARHIPMERVAFTDLPSASALIFLCRSGNRTRMNAQVLGARASCNSYVMEGGLDGWIKAGLPVIRDPAQPMEISRQTQIVAGTLVLAGVLLGAFFSPYFYALAGFVGAGLVFAGASGFCGMARLLMKMPWNRRPHASRQ